MLTKYFNFGTFVPSRDTWATVAKQKGKALIWLMCILSENQQKWLASFRWAIHRVHFYPIEVRKWMTKNKKNKHRCKKNTKMLIVCSTILFFLTKKMFAQNIEKQQCIRIARVRSRSWKKLNHRALQSCYLNVTPHLRFIRTLTQSTCNQRSRSATSWMTSLFTNYLSHLINLKWLTIVRQNFKINLFS